MTCKIFGLSRPLCSRLRPDIRDRHQTKASLNAPAYYGRRRGHNNASFHTNSHTNQMPPQIIHILRFFW